MIHLVMKKQMMAIKAPAPATMLIVIPSAEFVLLASRTSQTVMPAMTANTITATRTAIN